MGQGLPREHSNLNRRGSQLINKHLANGGDQPRKDAVTTIATEKFKCRYCGQQFEKVHQLASHVRITHKAEREKEPPPSRTSHSKGNAEKPQPVTEEGPKLTSMEAANEARIKTSTGEVVELAQQEKPKRGKKKRKQWSKEQYDLARAIIDAPQWRMANGRDVDWERVMMAHPDYRQLLDYAGYSKQFHCFIQRVRRGGGVRAKSTMSMVPLEPVAVEPVNGQVHQGILINGRQYGLSELERILKHYRELRHHLKACPECGYNLKEHTQCYNIVKRHMEAARIEED